MRALKGRTLAEAQSINYLQEGVRNTQYLWTTASNFTVAAVCFVFKHQFWFGSLSDFRQQKILLHLLSHKHDSKQLLKCESREISSFRASIWIKLTRFKGIRKYRNFLLQLFHIAVNLAYILIYLHSSGRCISAFWNRITLYMRNEVFYLFFAFEKRLYM